MLSRLPTHATGLICNHLFVRCFKNHPLAPGLKVHSSALPAEPSVSYMMLFKTPPPYTCCLMGHTHFNFSVPYLHLLQEDPRGQLDQAAPRDLGGHRGQLGLADLSRPREDRQFRLNTA